jgi:ATP-binding protein involved in chromosome partitioning
MTSTEQDRINNIINSVFFSDGTSVKSRSSNTVIKGTSLGIAVDITGIEIAEAESLRTQVIDIIKQKMHFEKINIVLTSSRDKTDKKNSQSPKLHVEGVKKILLVASGKGGVGKSTISALIAHRLKCNGYKVGIIDADIYGPSIPSIFALSGKPELRNNKMVPLQKNNIVINSIGFLTKPKASISWRGPMATKAIYQLLSLTDWGNLDYLIIDSPPGTGDIHLTILQNYIINQVIMVTTPQKISEIDVSRAINLYKNFDAPNLGIIENMSYYVNPATNEKIKIFSGDGGNKIATDFDLPFIARVPINTELSKACDAGVKLDNFTELVQGIDFFL